MKQKVKFFMGRELENLQGEVNDFIESNNINVLDLKVTGVTYVLICTVVYIEKD